MCVLFAFDPSRMAGGDERHRWSRLVRRTIPAADALYDEHLQAFRDEGPIS